MLPRWHILFGAIFAIVIWIAAPEINLFYLTLIFFASFLIDFDHYLCAVKTTKKLSLRNAFNHYEKLCAAQKNEIAKGIKKKFPEFHFFHTIEFHLLVGILSFYWVGFFYIFIGMVFHSVLDILSFAKGGTFHAREFFFFNWIRKKF